MRKSFKDNSSQKMFLQENLQSAYQSEVKASTNENVLSAVLTLLRELDPNGLEIAKREIEKKLQLKN